MDEFDAACGSSRGCGLVTARWRKGKLRCRSGREATVRLSLCGQRRATHVGRWVWVSNDDPLWVDKENKMEETIEICCWWCEKSALSRSCRFLLLNKKNKIHSLTKHCWYDKNQRHDHFILHLHIKHVCWSLSKGLSPIYNFQLSTKSGFQPQTPKPDNFGPLTLETVQFSTLG
jgi:hypothetical protein